jgi:ATPase involved in DNA repair
MHVEIQHYRYYRCIERVKFGLGGPLTLLVGPNGAGKTSYLEALFLGASKGLATPIGKPTLAWVVIGRGALLAFLSFYIGGKGGGRN